FDALAAKYQLSGGSILNVVRQAMRSSLRRGKRHRITMEDFTRAAERELKKSALLSTDHLQEAPRRERIGGYARGSDSFLFLDRDRIFVDHGIREEPTTHLLGFLPRDLRILGGLVDQEKLRAVDPSDPLEPEA